MEEDNSRTPVGRRVGQVSVGGGSESGNRGDREDDLDARGSRGRFRRGQRKT